MILSGEGVTVDPFSSRGLVCGTGRDGACSDMLVFVSIPIVIMSAGTLLLLTMLEFYLLIHLCMH